MNHLRVLIPISVVLLCAVACSAGESPESKAQTLLDQMAANDKILKQQQQQSAVQTQTQSSEITKETTTVSDIRGSNDQKAEAIARIVTEKSDGLLLVALGEVPLHGQLPSGEDYFGGHYRVFVTKSVHALTPDEMSQVDAHRDDIFQLTTRHIISTDESVTHVGVLTIYPDLWPAPFAPGSDFSGFDPADPSDLCVADGKDLLNIQEQPSGRTYLQVAQCEKAFAVRGTEVQYILDLLEQITEGDNR